MTFSYSITQEQTELEEFALSEDGMIALPAEVYAPITGENSIICYKAVRSAVECLLAAGTDPMTSSGIAGFDAALCQIMDRYGYLPPDEPREIIYEYSMTSSPKAKNTETVMLGREEARHLSSCVSEWSMASDMLCTVIKDNMIVAVSGVNDLSSEDDPEIYVECAPAYRGRGFGSAAASGMAAYLIEVAGNHRVRYCCKESNSASVKCAASAGFILNSRRLPFVFYR